MSSADNPLTSQPELDPSAIPSQESSRRTRSVKPLALKMEVFAARTSGVSKRKIAKELGIAENTVTAILKEGKFDSLIAAGKFGLSTAIFDSVETIAKKCKTSERSAMYVLDKMVFTEESGSRQFNQNIQVNVAIPRAKVEIVQPPQIASNSEIIEALPADTTTNSASADNSKR